MKKCIALVTLFCFMLTAQAQHTYHEISLPDLMKKYQQNASGIVIVDVRSDAEYYDSSSRFKNGNIGRIKGVAHIDVQDLEKSPEAVKSLEQYKDKEVYLICSHSYRSRNASNILTRNGFKNVNNVSGGMSEWYRRYDDLLPYRASLETSVKYKNTSSAQLYDLFASNSNILLIGINILPRTFYDSASQAFLKYMPVFKKAVFYNDSDSAKILELAKKNAGKPIILFNNYSYGAAEMADWLTSEGIPNAQYLVGGVNYFAEYVANKNRLQEASPWLLVNNSVNLVTPLYFCKQLAGKLGTMIVDLRHDTLFNKSNRGMKSDYTHLKTSSSFPFSKGIAEFEKIYPDKTLRYVFVSRNNVEGMELADELSKKGYKIYWILGGISRFDWYATNVETVDCGSYLLRP